jgi:hypothetical protein
VEREDGKFGLAIALGYHGESLVEEQGKRTSRGLKVVA